VFTARYGLNLYIFFRFILVFNLAVGQFSVRVFGLYHCSNAPYASSSVTAMINLSLEGNIRPATGCFVARGNV
jgi:hypothetical protein